MDIPGIRPLLPKNWPQEGLLKELINLADFDAPFRLYHHAILDVFPHQMTAEKVAMEIQDFHSFNLRYEGHYLGFLHSILEEEEKVWVEWDGPAAQEDDLWRSLIGLDVPERRLFLKTLRQSPPQPKHYQIESAKVIRMIGQCCTRELGFAKFFLPAKSCALTTNFDLSWPIFFSDPAHIPALQRVADQHQLHLRDLAAP